MSEQEITQSTIIRYLLGWLPIEEKTAVARHLLLNPAAAKNAADIKQFLHTLQLNWLTHQLEAHPSALTITTHTHSPPPPPPRHKQPQYPKIDKKLTNQPPAINLPFPLPTRSPANLSLRGGHKPSNLNISSEYGFKLNLFMGSFDHQKQLVTGEVQPITEATLPPELIGATIWLLPDKKDMGYQTTLDAQGQFTFDTKIPNGDYTLEMIWPGEFLEVLDVHITP